MDDLSRFCCQNPDCLDYGKRGHGNLTVCDHYGPQQRRLLYCQSCETRFSERKGTPFFDSHLPEDKVLAILAHLAEGCGICQTSRTPGKPRVSNGPPRRARRLANESARIMTRLVAYRFVDRHQLLYART